MSLIGQEHHLRPRIQSRERKDSEHEIGKKLFALKKKGEEEKKVMVEKEGWGTDSIFGR